MKKKVDIILASTRNLGIGKSNDLPWPKLKRDFQFFKNITSRTSKKEKKNSIIMGSKTFESMGKRILPGRVSVVLTSRKKHFEKNHQNKEELNKNLFFVESLKESIELSNHLEQIENQFIIGGGEVYNKVLQDHESFGVENIFWTRVFQEFECDRFLDKELFNEVKKTFKYKTVSKTMVDNHSINYDFVQMRKTNTVHDR
jgi:dihydrofolate reductase